MRAFKRGLGGAALALVIAAGLSAPVSAQPNIDFGDDTSEWANDGECDDPRFTGSAMADEVEDVDIARDATDCRTAFEAGTITLKDGGPPPLPTPNTPPPLPTPNTPPPLPPGGPDFGDDSSNWANDGECDDPRFTGTGMAEELEDADIGRDATDCRTAFEAGTITLVDGGDTPAPNQPPAMRDVDFGDDTSEWANDGECDDPRFTGSAMAEELEDVDIGRDASDCRAAFEAGEITLAEGADDAGTSPAAIDFGDDTSEWANDQECDDPRFTGRGMANELDDSNIGRDATDCRNAFEDGAIRLASDVTDDDDDTSNPNGGLAAMAARLDFGDDSGEWANDGECDDPAFFGPGVSAYADATNLLRDASDCRAAFIAGTAAFGQAISMPSAEGFNYGDDSSEWANDGQCDDLRFTGPGMAKKLSSSDVAADAADCRMLEEQGEVSIKPVYMPDYVNGAPYDSSSVSFGDNSSDYANDGQCDDPRFEGPGVAGTVFDSDIEADADDCRAAFEAGTATLK